MSFGVEF